MHPKQKPEKRSKNNNSHKYTVSSNFSPQVSEDIWVLVEKTFSIPQVFSKNVKSSTIDRQISLIRIN